MDPKEKEMPKIKHRVELSSYLGTITRTHVPIIIDSWRKVPKETKEKLWDLITLQAKGGIGRVDRSVLWKKARENKGKFNKITKPVINMIDELLEKAKEIRLPPPSPNDILCQALGKPDHPGPVVGQDPLVRPNSYFHQPSDDMKKIKEEIWEMVRKEMQDAATRQIMSPPTPHFDMGSNNIRQQLVLQPVVAEKPMFKMMEEPQPPLKHKPNARLPFPNPYEIINVGNDIGFELVWPTSLVILETEHPQVLDKGKKKIVKTPIIRKSKPQNHLIIKNFQKFVDDCLGKDKTYPIQLPISLFGAEFQTYISREDCEYIISSLEVSSNCISFYLWHMHDQLHIAKKESQFIFFNPFTISRAGFSTPQTEKIAQLLSKCLIECQDAKYGFMPYNPE
ncbi:hypothetical protein AAG906_005516 [Vitis piasezkii]